MKAIELTLEHESKLLEMCKNLFPELDITFSINDNSQDYLHVWKEDIISSNIHWLEFCMCHIKSKINELNGIPNHKVLLASDQGILINHPVDYLYKQFKKLKQ